MLNFQVKLTINQLKNWLNCQFELSVMLKHQIIPKDTICIQMTNKPLWSFDQLMTRSNSLKHIVYHTRQAKNSNRVPKVHELESFTKYLAAARKLVVVVIVVVVVQRVGNCGARQTSPYPRGKSGGRDYRPYFTSCVNHCWTLLVVLAITGRIDDSEQLVTSDLKARPHR